MRFCSNLNNPPKWDFSLSVFHDLSFAAWDFGNRFTLMDEVHVGKIAFLV